MQALDLRNNRLAALPPEIGSLAALQALYLERNPLEPNLAAAYKASTADVLRYLAALKSSAIELNEAKLILVGEGNVGKSCLLAALCGEEWVENRDTTHGIEIKPFQVQPAAGQPVRMNGCDFGGQKVYKPTHQFFFTAPAVYLVVWQPREGLDQNMVSDWIRLILRREPAAKVLIVATHGGPTGRQPDLVRQDFYDEFGEETVKGFFHVNSCPPDVHPATGKPCGECLGIAALQAAVAELAAQFPETRELVPTTWNAARRALKPEQPGAEGPGYLTVREVYQVFARHGVKGEDAKVLLRMCRRVGDLMYYDRHELKDDDIVVLRADWLTKAISYILDDKTTRDRQGLITFRRMSELWNDPARPPDERYPPPVHPTFLRLMEDYDLSYRVVRPDNPPIEQSESLIGQLVDDLRPGPPAGWEGAPADGEAEQVEVCRIVTVDGNRPAAAEGLFYQLIVRLHRYSLGKEDFARSKHWQRGLWLQDKLGAKAHLEHVGTDVRVTVRSPYPTRFLSALTYEVDWLTKTLWKGLDCVPSVPCMAPAGPCSGVFEIRDLLDSRKHGQKDERCLSCKQRQSIDRLLDQSTTGRPDPIAEIASELHDVKIRLDRFYRNSHEQHGQVMLVVLDKSNATNSAHPARRNPCRVSGAEVHGCAVASLAS